MYCQKCGAEVRPGDYCQNCGARITPEFKPEATEKKPSMAEEICAYFSIGLDIVFIPFFMFGAILYIAPVVCGFIGRKKTVGLVGMILGLVGLVFSLLFWIMMLVGLIGG